MAAVQFSWGHTYAFLKEGIPVDTMVFPQLISPEYVLKYSAYSIMRANAGLCYGLQDGDSHAPLHLNLTSVAKSKAVDVTEDYWRSKRITIREEDRTISELVPEANSNPGKTIVGDAYFETVTELGVHPHSLFIQDSDSMQYLSCLLYTSDAADE